MKLPGRRLLYKIEGTDFKIAVPYSINTGAYYKSKFELFGITMTLVSPHMGNRPGVLRASVPLPASWLVDLSGKAK